MFLIDYVTFLKNVGVKCFHNLGVIVSVGVGVIICVNVGGIICVNVGGIICVSVGVIVGVIICVSVGGIVSKPKFSKPEFSGSVLSKHLSIFPSVKELLMSGGVLELSVQYLLHVLSVCV